MDHYYISKKLPTYPSPKPTLTLTSHLGRNVCAGEGYVGSFPEAYNDPKRLLKNPKRTCNKVNHQNCDKNSTDYPYFLQKKLMILPAKKAEES